MNVLFSENGMEMEDVIENFVESNGLIGVLEFVPKCVPKCVQSKDTHWFFYVVIV